MKLNSRHDLRNKLRSGQIESVYLFFGAETYLRNLAASTITDIVLKDASLREFNDLSVSLVHEGIPSVLAKANQLPMMDSRKVLRIWDLRVSGSKNSDTLKDSDYDPLAEYLANPSNSTVLIMLADQLDKRRKISKLLLEKSYCVEFGVLSDNEIEGWAADRIADLGSTIAPQTLTLLVTLVGSSLRKLSLEIEKLTTAALPSGTITNDLVVNLVANSREISNFELTDSLLSANRKRSLEILRKILDDGAEPLMLLGLLSYNFRRLLQAKEMMLEGVDRKEVSRVMRLPFSRQRSFLELARKTDSERFRRILQSLASVDYAIKTSLGTPRLQIEFLIAGISRAS